MADIQPDVDMADAGEGAAAAVAAADTPAPAQAEDQPQDQDDQDKEQQREQSPAEQQEDADGEGTQKTPGPGGGQAEKAPPPKSGGNKRQHAERPSWEDPAALERLRQQLKQHGECMPIHVRGYNLHGTAIASVLTCCTRRCCQQVQHEPKQTIEAQNVASADARVWRCCFLLRKTPAGKELIEGWVCIVKERVGGNTAGQRDLYYKTPTGRLIR